jgi:hypothetical protein
LKRGRGGKDEEGTSAHGCQQACDVLTRVFSPVARCSFAVLLCCVLCFPRPSLFAPRRPFPSLPHCHTAVVCNSHALLTQPSSPFLVSPSHALRVPQQPLSALSFSRSDTVMAKHHPDLIMCRKQPGIAIGRLCAKCDGKCVICDSYVRPATLVRVCDEVRTTLAANDHERSRSQRA